MSKEGSNESYTAYFIYKYMHIDTLMYATYYIYSEKS